MTSRDIRRHFLDFFASKDHKIIPSAPMVAKSDPTLMFINSGMAPLKDFFLGNQTPPSRRVADTQKCLRVSGKHNDLEDVGMDGYHHTMFEMLGNWSFGDYFKKDALAWSWELLTEVYKIPKDRLYVSVFKGDEKERLPFDQEAFDTWKQFVAEDRILPFGKKENFWEMGEQGPCGPCSEIHVDLRSDEQRALIDGKTLVNADDPNVIEVWNNVFMQFNRKADGSLEELPAKSVDTGMGFERLCRAVQGVASNYDTDLWTPLFRFLEEISGKKYQGTYPGLDANWNKTDVAMRVVADHLRAVSFAIADGELPSNTGAGYVIRRILRRGVRYYYSVLDIKEPVLYRMAPILAEEFDGVFPELKSQINFVSEVILSEEKAFLRTLESGLKRIEVLEVSNNTINGAQAFELFDTYGFPLDLTNLIAREKGWQVDEAGFKIALQEQKDRSRKDAVKQVGDWLVLRDESDVAFVGYDLLETNASYVTKYRTVTVKGQEQYQVVLNRTPFYPEGGGQAGDTGYMIFGSEKIPVLDTKKENTLVIHLLAHLPEDIQHEEVYCAVDARRRRLTEGNHSATHLLHAALRQVLGTHVQQKGSYLDDAALRFDFQHFQKVSEEELLRIENIVNAKIRENIALDERRSIPIAEAQASGAMMLFGEKYGETVRMITFDPAYSRELCGGCHVKATGEIGYFKITTETAVAAGVRRIEAMTGAGAEQYVQALEQEMDSIKNVLKTKELTKAVVGLQDDLKRLQRKAESLYMQKASVFLRDLGTAYEEYNGVNLLVQRIDIDDISIVKTLVDNLESKMKDAVIVLANTIGDKTYLSIRISDNIVTNKAMHAGKMVQQLCTQFLNGGGGGQPKYATGSGANSAGLELALSAVKDYISVDETVAEQDTVLRMTYKDTLSDLAERLLIEFAKQPFLQDYDHPAWRYFKGKSSDYHRNQLLSRGRADFSKSYDDEVYGYSLQAYELVDMYAYYYMQVHYTSSLGVFTRTASFLERYLLNKKRTLFIDLGCGPMTSGAAFVEFYRNLESDSRPNLDYIGFDSAEPMMDKALLVAQWLKSQGLDFTFAFATAIDVLETQIEKYLHKYSDEQCMILINLCYVTAAEWFDVEENREIFANLLSGIQQKFAQQSVCVIYQNPDYRPLHRNWEQIKQKLADFGNIYERKGVLNFEFKDIVGSSKYPNPSFSTYFEFYFNETV